MNFNPSAFILLWILQGRTAYGFVEPDKAGTVAANEYEDDDLKNSADTKFSRADDLPDAAQAAKLRNLEKKFGLSNGSVRADARSGRVSSVFPDVPVIPGRGVRNRLLWSVSTHTDGHGPPSNPVPAATAAVRNWMTDNAADIGIGVDSELHEKFWNGVAHGASGENIQLHGRRHFKGVQVEDSRATASVVKGNLISVAFEKWADIPEDFSVEPTITADEAKDKVADHASIPLGEGETCKSVLKILTLADGPIPKKGLFRARNLSGKKSGYKPALVWEVCPKLVGQDVEMLKAFVDANTGKIYKFKDTVEYFEAMGNVYPNSNDGVAPDGQLQIGWPMPWMDLGSAITDAGGNAVVSGSVTARFDGPYVNMADNCGTDSLTQTDGIDWGGAGGTDCTTPGFGGAGNTHSSRSGFYEINKIKEIARSHLPNNNWLKGRLTANMNINNSCNAFWNGSTINFYRSGGGCANTGEIAAVFDHEWAHGMDANDVVGGIASPSGEGIADLYSALRLNDSCIGRNFLSSPCSGNGDPCNTCTGVRDIDYLKRASGNPHTYTWANANCGSSVHCLGGVYSEAVWSLYARILQEAPWNYDSNRAMEVVTRLLYIAAGKTSTWYSGSPPNGGCGGSSGYLNFLEADDDDGDLSNGTPHMSAIFKAFNDQEIACGTPAVLDSGCTSLPATAPQVTAAAGNNQVILTWDGVTDAAAYEVYRTEGVHQCGQGKVKLTMTPIPDDARSTPYSFTSTNLMNGREYYYVVIPKGSSDACFGPASDCVTAQPAAAPDVLLSCEQTPIDGSIDSAISTTRTCTMSSILGRTGNFNLSCSSNMSGVTCAIDTPSFVTLSADESETVTVSVVVATTAPTGQQGTIAITAQEEGGTGFNRNADIQLGPFYKSPTVTMGSGPHDATYDGILFGAPCCDITGSSCSTGTLVNGRANLGPEPNSAANTLDSCSDGTSGSYHSDESIDSIRVESTNENNVKGGDTITVVAGVWCYGTGTSDTADIYFTDNPFIPSWQYVGSYRCPSGGAQDITSDAITIPATQANSFMAVRVNFRYNGAAGSCTTGSWDDTDDLVFAVESTVVGTAAPSMSPTVSPTKNPSKAPSSAPTAPTANPTMSPSRSPTPPTNPPSDSPTKGPSLSPSKSPSVSPTKNPTKGPSVSPTRSPSFSPTKSPSRKPTPPTNPPSDSPTPTCRNRYDQAPKGCSTGIVPTTECCSGTCWTNGGKAGQCK